MMELDDSIVHFTTTYKYPACFSIGMTSRGRLLAAQHSSTTRGIEWDSSLLPQEIAGLN
jgi:hypothetical protein